MLLLLILMPLLNFLFISFFGHLIGKKGTIILVSSNMFINLLFLFYLFFNKINLLNNYNLNFGNWFNSGFYFIEWTFIFDDLIFNMFNIVTLISFLVHLYSINYMENDPHQNRFMSYLSLFTFFMYILITADTFIQLFLGWEGAGLCSYLLINFWYTRLLANKSALKAIIVNRISDFSLTFALFIIFYLFLSNNFSIFFALGNFFNFLTIKIFYELSIKILSLIIFLLYLSAVGKSAQILLHTWLPQAMEGPTPVSALIHAATMVTAGIFLIIKCSVIFELCSNTLILIAFWGAITSIFAASSGLFLSDIKQIIAYSTCSQLGYMVFICGISYYNIGLFHLMNHAIFKAALFLCAGAIIHSLNDEQDIRNMGKLFKILPLTYSCLLIASFAITGFPFLTGFYSKDLILENAYSLFGSSGIIFYIITCLTAFCTAFYSIRIIKNTFFNQPLYFFNYNKTLHESPIFISFVLFFLGLGSIYFGYFFKEFIIGFDNLTLTFSIFQKLKNFTQIEFEYINPFIKLIPLIITLFGIFFFFYYHYIIKKIIFFYNIKNIVIFYFVYNKWYFDYIYNNYITLVFFEKAKEYIYIMIDKGLIEFFGPFGIWEKLKSSHNILNKIQTGLLNNYILYLILIFWIFIYLSTSDLYGLLFINWFWPIKYVNMIFQKFLKYLKLLYYKKKLKWYLIKASFYLRYLDNRVAAFVSKSGTPWWIYFAGNLSQGYNEEDDDDEDEDYLEDDISVGVEYIPEDLTSDWGHGELINEDDVEYTEKERDEMEEYDLKQNEWFLKEVEYYQILAFKLDEMREEYDTWLRRFSKKKITYESIEDFITDLDNEFCDVFNVEPLYNYEEDFNTEAELECIYFDFEVFDVWSWSWHVLPKCELYYNMFSYYMTNFHPIITSIIVSFFATIALSLHFFLVSLAILCWETYFWSFHLILRIELFRVWEFADLNFLPYWYTANYLMACPFIFYLTNFFFLIWFSVINFLEKWLSKIRILKEFLMILVNLFNIIIYFFVYVLFMIFIWVFLINVLNSKYETSLEHFQFRIWDGWRYVKNKIYAWWPRRRMRDKLSWYYTYRFLPFKVGSWQRGSLFSPSLQVIRRYFLIIFPFYIIYVLIRVWWESDSFEFWKNTPNSINDTFSDNYFFKLRLTKWAWICLSIFLICFLNELNVHSFDDFINVFFEIKDYFFTK